MNKFNRRKYWSMPKILNIILFLILLTIIIAMTYSFFEPKFVLMYKKHEVISDTKIIDDLEECASKYYDALIYEKSYVVNEMQTYFNKKSPEEIKKISEKYADNMSYDLLVKQAYKLIGDVYLCDLEIIPEIDQNKYDWSNIKTAKVIIKLNRSNHTFQIYHDEFNLN